jgi:hypothetical protein
MAKELKPRVIRDMLGILRKRRDFLSSRIRASNKDLSYDKGEAGALSWALDELEKKYPECSPKEPPVLIPVKQPG